MLLYYAHSIRDYNTPKERAVLARYKRHTIINPNGDIVWRGSMRPYLMAVIKSQGVLVTDHEGFIGRGVYEEVSKALFNNRPVFYVDLNKIKLTKVKTVKLYDPQDWAKRYGELVLSNTQVIL